jgi:hypothetical protein
MSLWRIRILMPDDPRSRSALTDMLAAQSATHLRVVPGSAATSAKTGEVVVELPQDDGLANVLSALHEISPQVFVSRADASALPTAATGQ